MEAKDIIKTLMKEKDVTQIDVMKKLNLQSQSSVSSMLSRDMKASAIIKFLEVLDGKLIIKCGDTEYEVEK